MLFQFHKGTIKTHNQAWNVAYANQFQFHKGTIKTRRGIRRDVLCPAFQFHKGTIKTGFCSSFLTIGTEFQFHKGTIKTITPKMLEAKRRVNFNSIKVRLKHLLLRTHNRCHHHFNSIKVRLKLHFPCTTLRNCLKFQFHKGTIKTLVPHRRRYCSRISIP